MKAFKICLVLFIISVAIFFPFKSERVAGAADKTAKSGIAVLSVDTDKPVEEQLKDNVFEQLEKLDTDLFDSFLASLDDDAYQIFGSASFTEAVKGILSGEFNADAGSIFNALLDVLGKSFLSIAPLLISIGIISILSGVLSSLKSKFLGQNTHDIVYYVCFLAVVLVVATAVFQVTTLARNVIDNMRQFMGIIFPVILTLITASGGSSSGKLFQPLTSILTGGVTEIIVSVVFPIFVVITILNIVSNLSDNIKLNKLADFFKSAGKWIIGICFTVFIAFLSIQGILAGAMDGISIRAAKYAIGHSIPIVGNYIKDGFDLVLGSCVLIKNAVGVTGMLLMLGIVLGPIIQILVFSLGLRLTAGVIEPVTDKKLSGMVHAVSKNITMLLVAIISIAFMMFITLGVLIMSSNSVLA